MEEVGYLKSRPHKTDMDWMQEKVSEDLQEWKEVEHLEERNFASRRTGEIGRTLADADGGGCVADKVRRRRGAGGKNEQS